MWHYAARGVSVTSNCWPAEGGLTVGSAYRVKGTAWHLTPYPLAGSFTSFIPGKVSCKLQLQATHAANSTRVMLPGTHLCPTILATRTMGTDQLTCP